MKKENKKFLLQGFFTIHLPQFVVAMILFCTAANANAYSFYTDWDDLFAPAGLAPKMTGTVRSTGTDLPTIIMRGDNMLAVNAVKDTEFTINVTHLQLGAYTDLPTWELRTQDNTLLDSGSLLFDQADTIVYEHDKTEVLYLYVSTGLNCFYMTRSDVNVGAASGVITKFLGNLTKKMYVTVPPKAKSFTVTLYAGGTNEHVKVKVYNSSDNLVTQGETSSTNLSVDIPVTVGNDDDAVWYLEINTPSSGSLEDYAIKISADIPSVLSALAGDNFCYAPFGKNEPMSVIVDKVMAASEDYDHATWMIDAAKNAGFNTYVPRMFYGDSGTTGPDLTQFEELAGWCGTRNMKTLAWLRGTLRYSDYKEANEAKSVYSGKLYVPVSTESDILSPNSDEYWDYLTTRISSYATLSKSYPSIQGVLIDFEDYYTSGFSHAYHISYDDVIIDKYETAKSITVGTPVKDWLINNNYHDDFVDFQIAYWNTKCEDLRTAIDAINPQFMFVIYPFMPVNSVSPPFIFDENAPVAKLSSQQAPIVHAEVLCYASPYSIIHDADAISYAVAKNLDSDIASVEHDAPYMMLAGFDPYVINDHGDTLEFFARAPIVAAEKMQGYWVFYEILDYPSNDHTDCMNYFTWANNKIAAEDYDAADTSYTTNCSWDSLWSTEGELPCVEAIASHVNETFTTCKIRGIVPVFIYCEANESVTMELDLAQIGNYDTPLGWELRSASDIETTVQRGTVWITETSKTITFTPTVTGNYILSLAPLGNVVYVSEANAPWAYYAGKPVQFFQNSQALYINVPSGVSSFNITAKAAAALEQVKVSIYSPNNTLVAEEETSSTDLTKVITVNVGTYSSGAWKILTSAASTGSYEDFYLTVGPEIPQFISLSTDNIFSPKAAGFWYLNEGTGTVAVDASGNGNSGTLTNMDASTCWVNGKVDSALEFDGSNDYVDCGTNASLSFADNEAWSFEAWLYIEDGDGYWNAFTGCGSAANTKYLMIHYNNYIYFTSANGNYYSSYVNFTLDTWQHIAVTVDTSGNMRFYLNGVYKATVTPDTTAMDFYNIGRGAGNRYFSGIIDEVKIYDKTLSVEEIYEDYSQDI